MKIFENPYRNSWKELCERPLFNTQEIIPLVKNILSLVQIQGDIAIRELTQKYDKVSLEHIKVSEVEITEARNLLPNSLQTAINFAKANIEKFHASQKSLSPKIETTPGVICWQKSIGIEKVGFYIPGGTAPLFSTVLMLGVPAMIAGCKEISICTPPGFEGRVDPAILYAADLCGIKNIYRVGGAQAIAAMAYGTETIAAVDKIFGPGNQYVTAAKQLIAAEGIAIDLPAGPTELAIICDESAQADYLAADILSQLEHGVDSQVVLLTNSKNLIAKVITEIKTQGKVVNRREFVEASLKNSKFIIFEKLQDCIDFTNEYAPEHLIIATANSDNHAEQIINAGSVFIGNYSPEAIGDYASGTNHILPTNGSAKAWGGVCLDSFVKKISFQKITEDGLRSLAPIVDAMAQAEGLSAHRAAVLIRLKRKFKFY